MLWKQADDCHYYYDENMGGVFACISESTCQHPHIINFYVLENAETFPFPKENFCFGLEKSKKYVETLFKLFLKNIGIDDPGTTAD